MEPQKIDAIIELVPDAKCSVNYKGEVRWFSDDLQQPTEEAIQAKLKELEKQYADKEYQRKRLEEYPNTNDLIVALWEKVVEGRSESADALEVKRQEVKTAHPKPE